MEGAEAAAAGEAAGPATTARLEAEVRQLRGELAEARQYHAKQLRLLEERWEKEAAAGGAGDKGGGKARAAAPKPKEPEAPAMTAPGALAHLSPEKLLEVALRRSKALEKRLRSKDEAAAHSAAKAREEADRAQREINGYREQLAGLRAELDDRQQRLVHAEREHQERLERRVEAVKRHSLRAVNELNARMDRMRAAYSDQSTQGEVAQLRQAHAAEMSAARLEWHAARDEEEQKERQQYEAWLKERDNLVERLQRQIEEEAGAAALREAALRHEMRYLYEYVAKLTTVLQSMDAGLYPIRERCGVRTYRLPEHVREELLVDESRAASLDAHLEQLDSFIEAHSLRCGPVPFLAPRAEARAEAAAAPRREAAAGTTAAAERERAAAVEIKRLRGEVEALVMEKQGDRRALEDELASHETIEYIRSVEEELAFHKQALREEKRRTREMRIAADAQARLLRRLRGGSASRAATLS